ncbi:MAG: DUF2877 domain-containing protein [Pelolinea sp.]|nr:DUF2877 domain-containing protein [Pelolinea sp.]
MKHEIWDNAHMDDAGYLTAAAIGHGAREILQTETDASVWGDTSKGLFAVTDNKKALFISQQPFKGPLTINVNGNFPWHEKLSHGTHLVLAPDQIRFIQSDLIIKITPQTQVWTPTILNMTGFDLKAFINRSKLIEDEMISQLSNRKSDLTSSKPGNLAIQDQTQENNPNIENNLKSALYSRNEAAVFESLSNSLGYGEGLTPSGDDLICGFLLAAHAWEEILYPDFSFKKTILKIVETARKKTTALSANLIACAASGSADERIINCVKWFNNGGLSAALIMEELLSYGSSSGLDTLAGMLAFIQASPIVQQEL